ncbi:MAG: NAD(P)(+) transhydrogenase (Re/Si-specific) subunit beta [Sulfobacillus sp.]
MTAFAANLTQGVYIVTILLVIVGIMRLRTPATARSGNLLAAFGMLLALAVTLLYVPLVNWLVMTAMLVLGAGVGTWAARTVKMTAMPQMVALFNGMGGGAAALVALGEALRILLQGAAPPLAVSIPGAFTVLIGAISFAGSMVAFAKLQELIGGRPITFSGQKILHAVLFALLLVAAALAVGGGPLGRETPLIILAVGAAVLGALVVLPVGGADMPVIISLLNSLTGLAAAATGFVLGNDVLIVAGSLVGASGTILTQLMSRAMNRPISNVLFGAFSSVKQGTDQTVGGEVRATTTEEVATLLAYASRVVIVPGYGLAVARAQQQARDLMVALEGRGVDVRFGIHPVAGRMPGHMNVLLAEADVPYDRLYEMDAINPEFSRTDVVLVVGANDVTNPAARNNPGSPIYGMPVLEVDRAKVVVVLKRSMAPGFAGIDNPLFLMDQTRMLFGDARSSLTELLAALREVD